MANNNKKLHEAIRDIITQQGKSVIKDVRLVNILSDTVSFDDLPAAKAILRDILRSGYGGKLFELGDSGNGWRLKVKSFTTELAKDHGYRTDIVEYLFNCIAYGMGWINRVDDFAPNASEETIHADSKASKETLDLNAELKKAKDLYLHTLEEGIEIPTKGSGYYPAMVVNQLDFLKEKIKMLSDALHTDNTQWCIDKRQEMLNRYHKDTTGLKRRAIAKIAVPTVALLIGGSFGTAYLSAGPDRKQFKQSINEGDKFYAQSNYLMAINSYKDAYTNYDAFNESSYKSDAFNKISDATDKLVGEAENNPDKLAEARVALQTEQTMELSDADKSSVNQKLNQIDAKINTTVENGKNSLVLNISSNGGKLNAEGKSLLKQLLKLSPDDYWLNFMKKKEL